MISNTATATIGSPAGIPFSQLLDDYRLSLEAANKSPKTISWYAEILTRYFAFLESQGLIRPVHKLGKEELKAYVVYLQNTSRWSGNPHVKAPQGKLSAYSIQGHVRAIKAFFSWLAYEEYIEENPLARYSLPRVPEMLIPVLTPDQIEKLLAAIDKSTAVGARNYAVILLLLDTGVRISELVGIRIEALNLPYHLIQVFGKGQKQRTVPISNTTRKAIVRYTSHFRPQMCPPDCPYLFATAGGDAISVNSVQQALKRMANRAGLAGLRVSPHTFRHTFATQSMTKGANVFVIKEIMGHASLMTTLKYTHLQPRDLQTQHAIFSPVSNLGIAKKAK